MLLIHVASAYSGYIRNADSLLSKLSAALAAACGFAMLIGGIATLVFLAQPEPNGVDSNKAPIKSAEQSTEAEKPRRAVPEKQPVKSPAPAHTAPVQTPAPRKLPDKRPMILERRAQDV